MALTVSSCYKLRVCARHCYFIILFVSVLLVDMRAFLVHLYLRSWTNLAMEFIAMSSRQVANLIIGVIGRVHHAVFRAVECPVGTRAPAHLGGGLAAI